MFLVSMFEFVLGITKRDFEAGNGVWTSEWAKCYNGGKE